MSIPSRREVLTTAAATVALPMIGTVMGNLRTADAAATPIRAGGGMAPRSAPDEPAGWITTTIKPADVKDGEFTDVAGHMIALARTGKDITALSSKCTHQGCKITPKAGANTLTCPCHGGKFNLDGTVAKSPPRTPLANFAIRVNDAGLIEIDPGQKPTKDAAVFKITVS